MIKDWNLIKFGDLFDYENKSKIKAGEGMKIGKYPFYTSSVELTKFLNEFQFEKNSLIFGTGGNASIHYCDLPFSASTDCLVAFSKDDQKVDAKYVYYFLFGNINILEEGFKGAGLKHISKGYINEIKIPVPPLNIQKEIVEILNSADLLCRKDLELINKYEELSESIYIDLFGQPFKNERNFKKVKIADIVLKGKNKIRSGPFGSDLLHSEFVQSGISVLGIDNVVENRFRNRNQRFITEQKFNQLSRYQVFEDDVLVSIMGTVGRSAVVPKNIGLAINTKHLVAITTNKKLINPHFLNYSLIHNQEILFQIKQKSKGAIMDGLNIGIIKELELFLPPLELQNQFIKLLNIIIYQKELLLQKQSELLFNSISQKAFKGELM